MTEPSSDPTVRYRLLPMPMTLMIVLGLWVTPVGCAAAAGGNPGPGTLSVSAPASLAALPAVSSLPARQAAIEQPVLTPDELADIKFLTAILRNPANEPHTRAGAAVRLISIRHPQAIEPLVDALFSGDDDLMLAVAVAINEVSAPPLELLVPAIKALRTAQNATLDQLSLALTHYGESAYVKLLAIAHDQSLEPGDRVGAIAALGNIRTHDATESLVQLLTLQRDEPETIILAACEALQHATGLPYGDDDAQWRAWWDQAGDQPPEQWLTNLVQRLSEQLTRAEQKIELERESTIRVQQRLGQAYRDLFPRLDLNEQLRALPGLLGDPLPILRDFAVDRIARLLRDSVRIPEEVQDALAERINDEVPALQLQAARLLEQMNYDLLAARLGERLLEESNDELIEGFLDILAKRPGVVAFSAVVPLLESERHGDRAAIALWEIVNYEAVDEQRLALLRALADNSERIMQSPAHVRLLARTMPDEELAEIIALMDGEDVALKLAVAEGLMHRGAAAPLLDRVQDESIYPFAARAIARAESPWPGLRQLVALLPPAAHEAMWREQILHLALRLPTDRIIDADDLLASAPGVATDVRIRIIQRRLTPNDNGNSAPADQRVQLTIRLAELLLRTDQPGPALERLDALPEGTALTDVTPLRFRAMLRVGQYDRAQQLVPEPDDWITLLERWAEERPATAVALREEIERRFSGRLNDDLQEQLETVTERLPLVPPDASPGDTGHSSDTGEA